MRKWIILPIFLLLATVAMADSCDSKQAEQRKQSISQRADVFDQAQKAAPVVNPENFPLRKALVDFTTREDLIDHPWYTYILGQNGNTVGYYVTKTVPISTCNFLSSTQDKNDSVVLTAPSLDGIFYGGAGASANCGFFFFDYATNAMVTLAPGVLFFTVDQPLKLQAQPIEIIPR